jgi:hypothetical protein
MSMTMPKETPPWLREESVPLSEPGGTVASYSSNEGVPDNSAVPKMIFYTRYY